MRRRASWLAYLAVSFLARVTRSERLHSKALDMLESGYERYVLGIE